MEKYPYNMNKKIFKKSNLIYLNFLNFYYVYI